MIFLEDLRERYILARWCYLMGETYLSDIEYDKIDVEFKQKYPNDEYSKRPWSFDPCPSELLRKVGRTDLLCNPILGYMAESIPSINTSFDVRAQFGSLNKKSRLSYKIDGWNFRLSYYNGTLVQIKSRGRAGNNKYIAFNDIAPMFPFKIPFKGRVAITGELSIPNDKWKIYKDITGNSDQRASVSTALSRGDIEYLSFLSFDIYSDSEKFEGDKYDLLKSLGFKTPMFKWVNNYDQLLAAINYMSSMDSGYNYLTDGLVIENDSYQLAIRIGKWEEQIHNSYVMGYAETQGMYGYSLEVLMKPIMIKGKTCSRIAINNCANIEENNLQIGMPIAFNIRSSANNVLDVTNTYKLQVEWQGKYDKYCEMIDKRESEDGECEH